ncbi:S1 family peptidase, partial [Streptomyces galbus]
MRRSFVRALVRPVALAAAVMAIPLVTAAHAAEAAPGGVVVGGFPVDVSQSPWTVALSSRDQFGGTRSGQFCGGVAVGLTTVLTAAHCMGRDVLGTSASKARDLKVVTGRTDLSTTDGKEIAVREVWVNPAYRSSTKSGDFAVLTLSEPLPASAVIRMAPAGDPAYTAGTAATVYGWGDTAGTGAYPHSLRAASVHVLADAARRLWGDCLFYTSDAADGLPCVDLRGLSLHYKKQYHFHLHCRAPIRTSTSDRVCT